MKADSFQLANGADWPFVSVVVPVWNAENSLPYCISAVLRQDYPGNRFEAIFVDNLSRDRSLSILKDYRSQVTILQENRRGASAARNAGIRGAKGEYIAFTDSDCVPHGEWLKELVFAASGNPQADFIGGRIAAWNPRSEIETFVESLYDQRDAIERLHPPYAVSANLMIKREKLFELGLFDERFLRGQDVDLSYRGFFRHQARFAYASRAVVHHWNEKTLKGLLKKGFQHGKAASQIWKHYAKELQTSRRKKCADMRPYVQFMSRVPTYLKDAVHSRRNDRGPADVTTRFAFYDAVFKLGKQFGFLAQTIRDL